MPFLLLSLTVQVLFALHAYRTGRDRSWIYIILIFPTVGALIYFLAEVLPGIWHGPDGKKLRQTFGKKMDPNKEFRDAEYAFKSAPTVVNRIALAQIKEIAMS